MPSDSVTALISTILTPVVLGIVQALKQAGMPSRFGALVAVALGIFCGVGLLMSARVPDPFIAIVIGAAIGLSAAGLYSGTTALRSPAPDPVTLPQPPPGPMPPAA